MAVTKSGDTENWYGARIVNTVRVIAMGNCLVANSEMDYVSLIGSVLTEHGKIVKVENTEFSVYSVIEEDSEANEK